MHTQPTLAPAVAVAPPATLGSTAPAPAGSPLILFGRDERHRPHASRFAADDKPGADAAARLMGLHLAVADSESLRSLAARLPAGRLFPSGKGFVPFVKAELYRRLLAATGTPDQARPRAAAGKPAEAPPPAGAGSAGKGGPDSPDGAGKAPRDWGGIGIGSVVLACQGPMEGWWEAVVLYTKANDAFVLRWRDFPDDGEIIRARKDLGLLPPGSREGFV